MSIGRILRLVGSGGVARNLAGQLGFAREPFGPRAPSGVAASFSVARRGLSRHLVMEGE